MAGRVVVLIDLMQTCVASLDFLFEKHSKSYTWYDAVSIAEEKFEIAHKALQRRQLCWMAERAGVCVR